jgi:hypothetical protein
VSVAQARIVARIVHTYFPHLPFAPEHMTSFPIEAVDLAEKKSDLFEP